MSVFQGISGQTYQSDSGNASLGLSLPNGFLENLSSKSDTFSFLRSDAKYQLSITNGHASAYFSILQLIPTAKFSNDLQYDVPTKADVRVDLDIVLTINYELDRLDSNRSVENYQSQAESVASLTIRKSLNAHFLGLLATEIAKGADSGIATLESIADTSATDDEIKKD
jgi:hypothetical protein